MLQICKSIFTSIGDGLGGHRINTVNMIWGKVGRTEREYTRETLRGEHSGKRVAVLRRERIDHETCFANKLHILTMQ